MGPDNGFIIAFHVSCLIMTFAMMTYGTYKYYADESTSIVDAKAFHETEDDIYPSFSICMEVDDRKAGSLAIYNYTQIKEQIDTDGRYDNKRRNEYANFLMGIESNLNSFNDVKEMIDLNYDDVTVDLKNYLKQVEIKSGKTLLYEWNPDMKDQPIPLYISYRHPLVKCYSIDISQTVKSQNKMQGTTISRVVIRWYNQNRVFNSSSEILMASFMHYPKQLMRSAALHRDHLGISSTTFSSMINIGNIEVIRRRNTRHTPCLEEFDKADDLVMQRLIEKTKCRPSHLPDNHGFPKCNTVKEMAQALTPSLSSLNPDFLKDFDKNPGTPCSQVYAIAYTLQSLRPQISSGNGKKPDEGGQKQPPGKTTGIPPAGGAKPPGGPTSPDGPKPPGGTKPPGVTSPSQSSDSPGESTPLGGTTSPAALKSTGATKYNLSKRSLSDTGMLNISEPTPKLASLREAKKDRQIRNLEVGEPIHMNVPKMDSHSMTKRAAPGAVTAEELADKKSIDIYFKNSYYKEIKHVQSFNLENFVGNVGGYVGLFIGCAIWEAPDFLAWVFRKLKLIVGIVSGFGSGKNAIWKQSYEK